MAAIYVRMILTERMTIEQVPALWREQVRAILEDQRRGGADE